jgi:hypothetical protein
MLGTALQGGQGGEEAAARISLGSAVVIPGQEFSLPLYLATSDPAATKTSQITFDMALSSPGVTFVKLESTFLGEQVQAELSAQVEESKTHVKIAVPADSAHSLPVGPVSFLRFKVSDHSMGQDVKVLLENIEIRNTAGRLVMSPHESESGVTVVAPDMVPLFSCFFYMH